MSAKRSVVLPGSATHGTLGATGTLTWPARPGTCLATSVDWPHHMIGHIRWFRKTSAHKIIKTNHKSVEVLYLPVLSIQRVQLGLLAVH